MLHSFPPLDALQAALAASATGSFSAAADALDVTHGAISRRVASVEQWAGVAIFRRHGRGVRLTLDGQRVLARIERIADCLTGEIGALEDHVIGIYWPFRGEPDLREWGRQAIAQGARLGLPMVVEKRQPLVFRSWAPGDKLEKGVWNIPVPSGGENVVPSIVVAPLVGFDAGGFRLGYGGGFYDRTLASLPSKPLTIGVGFGFARLETIFPQWHDIPMDRLIIEEA